MTVAIALVGAGPAAAFPATPQGEQEQLAGVSCTSKAATCIAVGSYVTASGAEAPLAEERHGSKWTTLTTVDPSSGGASFTGVSCTSADDCTAVGSYDDVAADAPLTLAEHWDGSSWTVEPTPNATTFGGTPVWTVFNGVSCTAPTACTAVGYDQANGFLPVAERWDGSSWTMQSVPRPTNPGYDVTLDSVSCASATHCSAAGFNVNDFGSRQLTEH